MSDQAARATADSSGAATTGRGQDCASTAASSTSATPVPLCPTTPNTGTPNARESFSVSSRPPRAVISSTIVNATAVGSPSWSTVASSPSERCSALPSKMNKTASGRRSNALLPSMISRAMASSGLIAENP